MYTCTQNPQVWAVALLVTVDMESWRGWTLSEIVLRIPCTFGMIGFFCYERMNGRHRMGRSAPTNHHHTTPYPQTK